jgi:hypothetical protein
MGIIIVRTRTSWEVIDITVGFGTDCSNIDGGGVAAAVVLLVGS